MGATISRLLKMIRLFCRLSSLLWGSFAKETYDYKEPTSGSHPIVVSLSLQRGYYSGVAESVAESADNPEALENYNKVTRLQRYGSALVSREHPLIIGLFCGK